MCLMAKRQEFIWGFLPFYSLFLPISRRIWLKTSPKVVRTVSPIWSTMGCNSFTFVLIVLVAQSFKKTVFLKYYLRAILVSNTTDLEDGGKQFEKFLHIILSKYVSSASFYKGKTCSFIGDDSSCYRTESSRLIHLLLCNKFWFLCRIAGVPQSVSHW